MLAFPAPPTSRKLLPKVPAHIENTTLPMFSHRMLHPPPPQPVDSPSIPLRSSSLSTRRLADPPSPSPSRSEHTESVVLEYLQEPSSSEDFHDSEPETSPLQHKQSKLNRLKSLHLVSKTRREQAAQPPRDKDCKFPESPDTEERPGTPSPVNGEIIAALGYNIEKNIPINDNDVEVLKDPSLESTPTHSLSSSGFRSLTLPRILQQRPRFDSLKRSPPSPKSSGFSPLATVNPPSPSWSPVKLPPRESSLLKVQPEVNDSGDEMSSVSELFSPRCSDRSSFDDFDNDPFRKHPMQIIPATPIKNEQVWQEEQSEDRDLTPEESFESEASIMNWDLDMVYLYDDILDRYGDQQCEYLTQGIVPPKMRSTGRVIIPPPRTSSLCYDPKKLFRRSRFLRSPVTHPPLRTSSAKHFETVGVGI